MKKVLLSWCTPGGGEGELYFNIQNQSGWSSIYGGTPISINQWHHVALTYSPGRLRLYQNGELIKEGDNASGNIVNNDGDLWIGRYHDYDNYFNGLIDNVNIWDHEFSLSEIQSNMSTPPLGNEPGLVGYWNFNAADNSNVYGNAYVFDRTGNHGTIHGATFEEPSWNYSAQIHMQSL